MTRTRHRMPGLVVGLIAGLVQGLGPGWVSPYAALAAEPAIEGSGTSTSSQAPDALDFTTVTLDGENAEENAPAQLINTTSEESEAPTPNAAEGAAEGSESTPRPMTDTEVSEEQASSGEESLPGGAEDLVTTPVNTSPIFNLGSDVTVEEGSGAYTAANFLTDLSPVEEGQRVISLTVSSDNSALFTEDGQPAIDEEGTLTFTPAPAEPPR